jgi:hypothetical protein
MTSKLRYTAPAIVLHWLVALLIFVGFPLGVYMHELPLSPTKLQLYSYHKWNGITVLLLAGVRVAWRLTIGRRPCRTALRAGSVRPARRCMGCCIWGCCRFSGFTNPACPLRGQRQAREPAYPEGHECQRGAPDGLSAWA